MMRNLIVIGFVFVLAVIPLEAAAHRLVPDDGSHTTAETAIFLEDAGLSQVVYHEVTPTSNALWIAFDATAGENLYWQLGLPAIKGLENYRPSVAVLGPGLPAADLPFPVPDGLGGIVVNTAGMVPEVFEEHFTGTEDWIITQEDRTLTHSGRYYVVLYHPDGTPGKCWIAIGRREEFGLSDILSYVDVLAFVRQYHEVGDEPLPLLPSILLAFSQAMRVIFQSLSFLGLEMMAFKGLL